MDFITCVKRRFLLSVLVSLLLLNGINSQWARNPDRSFTKTRPDNDPIHFNQDSYIDTYAPRPQRAKTAGQSYSAVADSITDFSINLFKDVARNTRGNVITSPISMATLLSLLTQGASGNSLLEMERVLKMKRDVARNSFAGFIENIKSKRSKNQIDFSNAVFVDRDYPLNNAFKNVAKNDFNANIDSTNFKNPPQAAAQINQWVNEQTQGRIPAILSPNSIDYNTNCVLANAVYFKGVWKNTFPAERTMNRPFQPQIGKDVMCSFMHQTGKFVAGENTDIGAKWLELPFDQNEFSMVFIIPSAQHELDTLIARMTANDLKTIFNQREPIKVNMGIPKFNINFETSLVSALKNLGINKIFSHDSGLTEIALGQPVQVSEALHRAGVSIDEIGSVAAAASALSINTLSLSSYLEEFYFNANQPFLAIILDKANNIPLFIAKIEDPTKPF